MIFVLDASAMIAYLRNEQGARKAMQVLADPNNQCLAHAVNLCEVFYDFTGPTIAAEALNDLARAASWRVLKSREISGKRWVRSRPLLGEFRSPTVS